MKGLAEMIAKKASEKFGGGDKKEEKKSSEAELSAQDLLDAIQDGDRAALLAAFKSLSAHCSSSYEEEEED
jgi:hypothetical protein